MQEARGRAEEIHQEAEEMKKPKLRKVTVRGKGPDEISALQVAMRKIEKCLAEDNGWQLLSIDERVIYGYSENRKTDEVELICWMIQYPRGLR